MADVAGWFKKHVVPLGPLALLATGCGGGSNDDTTDATITPSSVAMAGPATFVAEVRAISFGTKDLASASDKHLVQLGTVVCDGLGIKGLGFGRVVQRLVRSEAPDERRSDGLCQKRGAQSLPAVCKRHPLTS
jgi:hypothetical protein